jgi:hypothetical protein
MVARDMEMAQAGEDDEERKNRPGKVEKESVRGTKVMQLIKLSFIKRRARKNIIPIKFLSRKKVAFEYRMPAPLFLL